MSRQVSIAVGIALLCAGTVANGGEWQFSPRSQVSSGYTENPRYLPDGGDGELTSFADASATLTGGTERWQLSFTPRATFSRYERETDLDSNNQYLDATSLWRGERVNWSASAQAGRDSTQTSELGTTGLVEGNDRRTFWSANAGPRWSWSETLSSAASLGWSDTRYQDADAEDLADFTRASASLSLTRAWSERTSLTLSVRAGELDSRAQVTRDAGLTLGFNRALGTLWSVALSAGPSWAESGAETNSGSLFSADLTRRGERTQFAASASRRQDATGRGVLTQLDTARISVGRQLMEHLSLSGNVQLNRSEELFSIATLSEQDTRYYSIGSALSWRFASSWTLSFNIEERLQEIRPVGRATREADSQRISLALSWNGATRIL